MKNGSILERVLTQVEHMMPGELASDMRENVRKSMESVIGEMDLVTREEFDIQRKMLDKALERVAKLEAQLHSDDAKDDA